MASSSSSSSGSFLSSVTWQGVLVGFVGAIVVGAVLAKGRK